jgi:hypothetical protein
VSGLLNQAELARRLGVSSAYIAQCVTAGRLELDADGLLEVEASAAALGRVLLAEGSERIEERERSEAIEREAAPAGCAPAAAVPGLTFTQARIEREKAQTALALLEVEKRSGRLVERAAVNREAYELGRSLRENLLALPDALADELAELDEREEIRARLAEELEHALGLVVDACR